ncbi:ATP-binding protein [Ruminiclostridium cellulolyticum]|uniref:4Fe-4S ferredoxin iron-sulfur binding domain protein n=1 Tax=Ruminiclostridium cellulolyticum (strain ATCC 35319 / DSM 5812 / JCM 6584 / H10) TaxID=394503 RepID=B8I1B5_RUMCH|nr:4Fe-4S dicluster domain-containing protein [Ruminiclostridium cellulolyticum]ACL75713.1 4Fe-4S ferredoxin iron-sulfur binding domain protein [Ruminiclostridium cellulolyticum H10]
MKRKIISIDEEKCNGCGLCVTACHEGALVMENGKAKLISDSYCDGLGDCLPACPTNAITIEEREAEAYDEELVKKNIAMRAAAQNQTGQHNTHGGCPGSRAMAIRKAPAKEPAASAVSELMQWPCQIKLVPVNAPYFDNCDLLIAADCTAFAYANIHRDFMKNRITLIGCPKLDEGDYSEKLTAIIANNNINSVKVVRMEVPCCGGIVNAVKTALINSGKMLPWSIVTISTNGEVLQS